MVAGEDGDPDWPPDFEEKQAAVGILVAAYRGTTTTPAKAGVQLLMAAD